MNEVMIPRRLKSVADGTTILFASNVMTLFPLCACQTCYDNIGKPGTYPAWQDLAKATDSGDYAMA